MDAHERCPCLTFKKHWTYDKLEPTTPFGIWYTRRDAQTPTEPQVPESASRYMRWCRATEWRKHYNQDIADLNTKLHYTPGRFDTRERIYDQRF